MIKIDFKQKLGEYVEKITGKSVGFSPLDVSLPLFLNRYSFVRGPAFMNFKAAAIFELAGAVCAVAGTVMFNFFSVSSLSAINSSVTASFGLYIYCAVMIAETVFLFCFVPYSKKFKALN